MHRFFVNEKEFHGSHFKTDNKDLCHQLNRVLRLKPGDRSILLDNSGREFLVAWKTIGKSCSDATQLPHATAPSFSQKKHSLHLFVPPLKNQNRWEIMLEKCTEIGVDEFTPLLTERTEVPILRKLDRLERIMREAAEQSGRRTLPIIHEPLKFEEALKQVPKGGLNLIASLREGARPLVKILEEHSELLDRPLSGGREKSSIFLLIGPVGDFTEAEIRKSVDAGCVPISLGSQILRTETAAIVATAVIKNITVC